MHLDETPIAALPGGLVLLAGLCVWVLYLRWKEGGRSGRGRIAALLAGAAAAPATLPLYALLAGAGLRVDWDEIGAAPAGRAMALCLAIGIVEEGLKAVPTLLLSHRPLTSPADGILLAAYGGVGFATGEGLAALLRGAPSLAEVLARAAAAPLCHAVLAAPLGYARWAFAVRLWRRALCAALAAPAAHALYDLLLTRPQPCPLLSAAVILALWVFVIVELERAAPAPAVLEVAGGGSAGT